MITDFAFITFFCQVMLNTERLLKHAVQERLAVTICINKVGMANYFLLIIFLIMKMILFIYLFDIIFFLSVNVILRCGFGGQFTCLYVLLSD